MIQGEALGKTDTKSRSTHPEGGGSDARLVDTFLAYLMREAPVYAKQVQETAARAPVLFHQLAEPMLTWASGAIGADWCETLAHGYMAIVVDVNRCQAEYTRRGRYQFSTYAEVFAQTYGDAEFMAEYHWGVYVATFAWEHHLRVYDFFMRYFVDPLSENGTGHRLLDLGCGSGIWSILALSHLEGWDSTLVDISSATVEMTRRTLRSAGVDPRADLRQADALQFHEDKSFNAAISSCLLEHLEEPKRLLDNISASLGERGLAFVSAALTAAQTDHIREFRRESEVVNLAEQAGFRVVASYSSAPRKTPADAVFLPRTMALVLQKRAGEYW